MKRTPVLLLCIMFSLLVNAQQSKLPLLQEIYYTVKVYEPELHKVEKQWWSNNLEGAAHADLVVKLFNSVVDGKLKAFEPQYPYSTPMSAAKASSLACYIDTLTDTLAGTPVKILLQPSQLSTIGFHEHWRYDSLNFVLQKEVKGIVLYRKWLSYNGTTRQEPMCYIPLNPADAATASPANLITPTITYEMRIKNFDQWERDRNWWNENLEPSKRYALVNSIYTAALNGNLRVCNAEYPFEKKLSPADVENIATVIDSVYIEDPNLYEMVMERVVSKTSYDQLNWLRFHESWYFDPVKMAIHKQIKGFALAKDQVGEPGMLRKDIFKPMFYVPSKNIKDDVKDAVVNVSRIDVFTCIDGNNSAAGVDAAKWKEQMSLLLNDIKGRKRTALQTAIQSGNADPLAREALAPAEIDQKLANTDAANVSGVRLSESWSFDPASYKFTKSTITIEPMKKTERGYLTLFGFAAPANEPSRDPAHLMGNNIEYDAEIANNASVEEDMYLQGSWWADNLEISKRVAIVQCWLNDASSGKRAVYSSSDMSKKLSANEVKDRLFFYHTDWGGDDNMYPDTIDIHEVTALRFHEAWYFDGAKGSFYKQVKGVTLLAFTTDPKNRFPLFYIPLNR